jgi:hypothetical protein
MVVKIIKLANQVHYSNTTEKLLEHGYELLNAMRLNGYSLFTYNHLFCLLKDQLIEGKEEKRNLKRLEEMIGSMDSVKTIGIRSR